MDNRGALILASVALAAFFVMCYYIDEYWT